MNSDLLQGFHLGNLLIEPLKGQVTDHAGSRHLPPKAVEVLLCLAREPGDLVTREDLLSAVWGSGHGSQEALSHAVGVIRHALDDHPDSPQYIQTLPRRGYRLLVEPLSEPPEETVRIAPSGFWESLLRHGVVQASAAYLVAGWLLIQVADATFVDLGLPVWSKSFVTFTVIGGFPLLLLLTWCFDFIGGRIEHDAGRHTGGLIHGLERNYLAIFVAYLVSAASTASYQAIVGFDIAQPETTIAGDSQQDLIPVVENSLAVLQLLNIDGDLKTQAFSDGLSEDILDRLASIPGLRVSARGDSWSLPPNAASGVVRRRLRVASYIEGSVRFFDDKLRVVVQLIDSASGFHLFSRSFELETGNIGDLQKTVTGLVVANLKLAVDISTIESASFYSSNKDEDAYYSHLLGREALTRPRSPENIAEAIRYFDDALLIDAQYPAAHAGRCSAFVALYVLQQDTENIALAETACANAHNIAPRLPLVLNSVANLYRRTGRAAEAEVLYLDVLKIDAQNVIAMQGLARILRRAQNFEEAELLMRKSIELQPGNWNSINALGNMYFRMGRFVEAITEYRKVVFLDPDNYVTLGNLASANLMIGDFIAARGALEQTIAIEENDTFYANLGIAHYYLGDFPEAVAAHRRSVELAPSSSGGWLGLADALYFAGVKAEADSAYRTSIDLSRQQLAVNPEDVENMTSLAWASAMTGSLDTATSLIDQAVDLDPADPYSYYFRALVLLKQGDSTGALDSIKDAIGNGYPVAMLAAEPILKDLKSDSRFESLLATAGVKGEE